jgi:hypothetical protein
MDTLPKADEQKFRDGIVIAALMSQIVVTEGSEEEVNKLIHDASVSIAKEMWDDSDVRFDDLLETTRQKYRQVCVNIAQQFLNDSFRKAPKG